MRFEIQQSEHIKVVYGQDVVSGVFLAVTDARLEYQVEATREVNHRIAESVGLGDGGGSYFDLHTGAHGVGAQVDPKTMATYLRRYGLPDEDVRLLLPSTNTNRQLCCICKAPGRSCCSHSCRTQRYYRHV